MRRFVALFIAFAAGTAAPLGSADAGEKGDVVLTVGSSTVTASELERRLKAVPPFQLPTWGHTPAEIRKAFVEDVLVRELLFYEEAKRRGSDKSGPVADRVRDTLSQAMEAEVKGAVSEVTPEEIKAYYEANRHRFNTPRRIKLWRILVSDEAKAKALLSRLKVNELEGAKRWNEAARSESLDKATNMRDGDLGFVTPDGQTEMPQVRVDPALFAASEKVKDGEIVPEPVKEGDNWAVVWRRGSLEAVNRTLAQEVMSIRQVLGRQKLQDAVTELTKKLEREHVKNVNAELLSYVLVDTSGDVGTRQKPGVIPRHRPRGAPTPTRGERGLR